MDAMNIFALCYSITKQWNRSKTEKYDVERKRWREKKKRTESKKRNKKGKEGIEEKSDCHAICCFDM